MDRPIEETRKLAKDLILVVSDIEQDEITRIMALWSLEGLGHYDHELVVALLETESDNLRREVVRSLQSFSLGADTLTTLLAGAAKDSNPMVRSEVLRTLDAVATANRQTIGLLVGACNPPLEGNAMGGAYERNFERYLARKALENYPEELSKFIGSSEAGHFETSNLIWASQALPNKERESVFVKLWKETSNKTFDEPTFVIMAGMLDNANVREAVLPQLKDLNKASEHVSLTLKNLSQVQSDQLTSALVDPVKSLLQSGDKDKKLLGLDAVGKLNISSLRNLVVPFVDENSSVETMRFALIALSREPKRNLATFQKMAEMETLDMDLRAMALQNMAKGDITKTGETLVAWLPKLDDTYKGKIISILSQSKEGSTVLKNLLSKEELSSKEFNISSAEKVFESNPEDAVGKQLFDAVKNRIEEEKKAFAIKLERMMAIAENGGGDPEKGEQLFQACLMCHRVGDQGQDFAPALDGSALRENEALLTAILDPNEAVEGSYAVNRVAKTDGNSVEGFVVKQDGSGTTVGYWGSRHQL